MLEKLREVSAYLIFGVLTTLVNIISFYIFDNLLNINYLIANIISWFLSIIFAYITNKKYVFKNHKKDNFKTFILFISSRLTTLLLDMLFMILLIEKIQLSELNSKIIVQIMVVIINYLLSKLIVFKDKD